MKIVSAIEISSPGTVEIFPAIFGWGIDGLKGDGVLRTGTFIANLAYHYQGLELLPEFEFPIAIGKLGKPYRWDDDRWVASEDPQFQSISDLRVRLAQWTGPIQFWIELQANKPLKEIRISYSLPVHDIPSYLRDFALPSIAQESVEICRDVRPVDGRITIPEGINPERILSALFLSPGLSTFVATVTDGKITLDAFAPDEPGKLILDYRMAARGTSDDFDQIDDAPMVLIREVRRENIYYPIADSGPSVVTAQDTVIRQDTESLADSIFEVQVLARRSDDARSLASQIRGRLSALGQIDCLAYGISVPISVEGAIAFVGSTRAIGDLDRASFFVRAHQIVQSSILSESSHLDPSVDYVISL